MNKIDSSTDLITSLRAQLANRASNNKKATAETQSEELDKPSLEATIVSAQEIKKRIGRQIKQLNLSTESERRHARRIFLESIIAWDFGDRVLNDRNFDAIVKDVEKSLSSDANVSSTFDLLIETLRSSST